MRTLESVDGVTGQDADDLGVDAMIQTGCDEHAALKSGYLVIRTRPQLGPLSPGATVQMRLLA
jgi:hypothetical protein